ncbi:MAG: Alpha-amylase precursor [Tenericutes bacterium ADurb.BinA155]|nr:MAG: Alpha-amylase precursor [Tenericutes bacterium ADurb.BinA155]
MAARTYAKSTYSRDLFAYGEILNSAGNSRSYSNYTPYFDALTDNKAGNSIRSAVDSNNTGGMANINYPSGLAAKYTVLWGESHDTYMNSDGESKNSSQSNVDKAYCLVTAHKDASSLYFIRPGSSMNTAQSESYVSAPIAAANKFHVAFEGTNEASSTGSNCAAIQRYGNGSYGAVIVTTSSSSFSVNLSNLPDGNYKDLVSGNTFTLSSRSLSGTAASGVVVLVKA